ncbi:MAG: hypothetical protein ABH829_03280 [archaeon]
MENKLTVEMVTAIIVGVVILIIAAILVFHSEKQVCANGEMICINGTYRECRLGSWIERGPCESMPLRINLTDLSERPLDFENENIRINGIVLERGDGNVRVGDANFSVWVNCISEDCTGTKKGDNIYVNAMPLYVKEYNISYSLTGGYKTLSAKRPLNARMYPISLEGGITSEECSALASDGRYHVENPLDPTEDTEFTMLWVGYTASKKAYDSLLGSLCSVEKANYYGIFVEGTEQPVWCGKPMGGDYCYVTFSQLVPKVAWQGNASYVEVKSVCDAYGGRMATDVIQRQVLTDGLDTYKPPFCTIAVFIEAEKLPTRADCLSEGGRVIESESMCKVIKQADIDVCTEQGDAVDGDYCVDKSACVDKGKSFEYIGGQYYCVQPPIVRNEIFANFTGSCLLAKDKLICTEFEVLETLIKDMRLQEV